MIGRVGVGADASQSVEVDLGEEEAGHTDEKHCVKICEDYYGVQSQQTAITQQIKCEAPSFLSRHLVPFVNDEHDSWF